MSRTIARLTFYTVALVLFAWTASLTVSFLSNSLPGVFWIVPYLGLVVFDGGLVAWLIVYMHYAQGNMQRAIALILTAFDLIGVGLMVIAEILLSGQTLTAAPAALGTAAIWGVGVWTVANVIGVVLFHLGDPATRKAIAIQSAKDAIWDGAFAELEKRRVAEQARLADELSATMFAEMLAEIATSAHAAVATTPAPVATSVAPRVVYPELQNTIADDIRAVVATPNGTDPNA